MWLTLGSGTVAAAGVGPKAALLDRARAAGLPVPPGVVLPDGVTAVALPDDVEGPLAVRSAFSVEDGGDRSHAGTFDTLLGVSTDPRAVADAVVAVRASGDGHDVRRDVLVMTQVAARTAGVAFTDAAFEDDLVNQTTGSGAALAAGRTSGQRLALPRLRRFERADRQLPPAARRLSHLLRDVRAEFGAADWDVEWADDGTACWLLQVRPVTAPPRRDEAFTLANHKEILPELPSTFMTSVIAGASRDLLGYYRRVDASLPVDREFVEVFGGRPYLNLSLLTDLMRALGLPTRLVTDAYGGEPDVVVGVRPARLASQLPTLLRLGLGQLRAVGRADAAAARIERRGRGDLADCTAAVAAFRAVYVDLVTEMSVLASVLAPPVAVLRRTGTLARHLTRHRTAATAMLDDLAPLVELAEGDAAVRAAVEEATVPQDPRFRAAWRDWLDRHGHRGVFESDIARPRFAEDPAPILRAVAARAATRTSRPGRDLATALTTPVWLAVRRPMAARERLRSRAMRGFAAIRARLLALAAEAADEGRLPAASDVWLLTADEVITLDHGAVFDDDAVARRRSERRRLAALRLPDTVHRFDDLDAGRRDGHAPMAVIGASLVPGVVQGRALRATEPPATLPDGFHGDDTVLVARSVDAGWVPIFRQVAGVAVEIGGDLSHGSIILRELGVPSVTNLGQLGAAPATGDRVELDADRGRLRLLEA